MLLVSKFSRAGLQVDARAEITIQDFSLLHSYAIRLSCFFTILVTNVLVFSFA